MSNVEQIEGQIKELSPDELMAFRMWFAQFDADAWDQQIETDVKHGALYEVAESALANHKAARSTLL